MKKKRKNYYFNPMINNFLNASSQNIGRKFLIIHNFFNGFGFNFLGDTTVILMAIYCGASNMQLGYLASALQISGCILVAVPHLLVGFPIMKIYFWSWLLRGFVCMLYMFIPFLKPTHSVFLIMLVYTLFCMFRAIGVVMLQPLQRILSTEENSGELVADMAIKSSYSSIIARCISAFLLSIEKLAGLPGLLILQILGIISNTAASIFLNKIPVQELITSQKGNGILSTFVNSYRHKERLIVLTLNWGSVCLGVLWGFTVPFLRKSALFSTSQIFIYTIAATIAAILANALIKPVVNLIGSKSILTFGHFCLFTMAIVWCFISPDTKWFFLMALGFISSFVMNAVGLVVSRLYILSFPSDDHVAYSSMYSFLSSIAAIGTGLLAGWLSDKAVDLQLSLLHNYSLTYLCFAAFALVNFLLSFRLVESKGFTLKEITAVILRRGVEKIFG